MTELNVTRERVNSYRLEKHGLWPRHGNLVKAVEGCGFLPSRESAYLSLAARVEGFTRADLDRAVFTDGWLMEVATSRGRWSSNGCPSIDVTVPPASRTIRTPAATSQACTLVA